MKLNKAAFAAALIIGGGAMLAEAVPVTAQALDSLRQQQSRRQQRQQQQEPRIGTLDARESAAIFPFYTAAQAQDWATARTTLPQARAGASSPAGKFLVGQLMFQLARGTQDRALEGEAVTQMVRSGGASPEQLAELQRLQSDTAFDSALAAGNFPAIEAQLEQRLAASPNDVTLLEQLATVKGRVNKHGEALALLVRAIAARQAGGQPITPELRQRLAGSAYQAHSPDTLRYLREWLAVAPSTQAWHDTLAIYAEQDSTPAMKLDIYRLMRVAGAMSADRDYAQYIEVAMEGRTYGEAKAVIEDGLRRNLLTTNAGYARDRLTLVNQRTAGDRESLPNERRAAMAGSDGGNALRLGDTFYGYGDFAAAAELYRAALQKGGQDTNLLNIRLAAALAQAGDRPGAETALRAVTSGPRAELAQLWLIWLAQPRP